MADNASVRDHLANERTYLAWMRTGISTMGFGVVIAKLRYVFPQGSLGPPQQGIIHASNLGLIFTVIGLLTVVVSTWRYTVVHRQITTASYETSRAVVLMFSGAVVILGVLIVWYLMEGAAASK